MRQWQQPLSEEKIAMLQEQFELARIRIEAIWGSPGRPWAEVRAEAIRKGLLPPTIELEGK
jgi:hypothetical protein